MQRTRIEPVDARVSTVTLHSYMLESTLTMMVVARCVRYGEVKEQAALYQLSEC